MKKCVGAFVGAICLMSTAPAQGETKTYDQVSYYKIDVKTGKATLKKVTFQQNEKGFK